MRTPRTPPLPILLLVSTADTPLCLFSFQKCPCPFGIPEINSHIGTRICPSLNSYRGTALGSTDGQNFSLGNLIPRKIHSPEAALSARLPSRRWVPAKSRQRPRRASCSSPDPTWSIQDLHLPRECREQCARRSLLGPAPVVSVGWEAHVAIKRDVGMG